MRVYRRFQNVSALVDERHLVNIHFVRGEHPHPVVIKRIIAAVIQKFPSVPAAAMGKIYSLLFIVAHSHAVRRVRVGVSVRTIFEIENKIDVFARIVGFKRTYFADICVYFIYAFIDSVRDVERNVTCIGRRNGASVAC